MGSHSVTCHPTNHSAPASAALPEGSRADCIQICSPRVQVSSRACTCIPYWRALLGGRCRGSSTTSFQFIFVTDCQPHPTVYPRWPSFSGRRCLRLNSLPDLVTSAPSVAVFQSRLKTHLFNISYPSPLCRGRFQRERLGTAFPKLFWQWEWPTAFPGTQ